MEFHEGINYITGLPYYRLSLWVFCLTLYLFLSLYVCLLVSLSVSLCFFSLCLSVSLYNYMFLSLFLCIYLSSRCLFLSVRAFSWSDERSGNNHRICNSSGSRWIGKNLVLQDLHLRHGRCRYPTKKTQKEIRKIEQNISHGTPFTFADKESQCIENRFIFKVQPSFSLNLSVKIKGLEF